MFHSLFALSILALVGTALAWLVLGTRHSRSRMFSARPVPIYRYINGLRGAGRLEIDTPSVSRGSQRGWALLSSSMRARRSVRVVVK